MLKLERDKQSESVQRKEDSNAAPSAATQTLGPLQPAGPLAPADPVQLSTPPSPVVTSTTLDGVVSRKGEGSAEGGAGAALDQAAQDSGSPVDAGVARNFSATTGQDVSGVRVHTGADSAVAAKSIQAKAYTTGQDVHFAAGQYNPGTASGDHLISHELAHTVQQGVGGGSGRQHKLEISQPGDAHETQADQVADAVVSGGRVDSAMLSASSVSRQIMRVPDPPAGGAPAGGAAAASTGPLTAYDRADFLNSIEHSFTARMLIAAAFAPAQAMSDALAASKYIPFFRVIRETRPLSDSHRTKLLAIFNGVTGWADKKNIIESQFGVRIGPTTEGGSWAGDPVRTTGRDFTIPELNAIYTAATQVPPGHIENNPHFVRLLRSSGGVDPTTGRSVNAEGSYGSDTINMDNLRGAGGAAEIRRYTSTFRHEVGHAVEARVPGVTTLYQSSAGWRRGLGVDAWIAGVGGYGSIPAGLQGKVKAALVAYKGSGGTFDAPTPTFEATLQTKVSAAELTTLQALYTTNDLLKACISTQGFANYHRYVDWPGGGGNHWCLNHYYAEFMSLSDATWGSLKTWGDQSAAKSAAFSGPEWWAEVYQDWYKNGPSGTGHESQPPYVVDFMTRLATFNAAAPGAGPSGAPAAAPAPPAAGGQQQGGGGNLPGAPEDGSSGGGGGHPRVPRG